MRRGVIGRCDTYYDLLESHGRTDRGSKIEGRLTVAGSWWLVAGGGFLVPSYKQLATCTPAVHCHPERQRRISVKIASDSNVGKYQSAGRMASLSFRPQESGEIILQNGAWQPVVEVIEL